MKKPELMAPVSDWTTLVAAVKAGADAVYFGVSKLNMRLKAKNFLLEELPKIVDYCHKNNVKAYLTVNVIVLESELNELDAILENAKIAGIDMVICWDMAVVKKAKELGLKICLSTQASASNSEAVKFFKSLGVERIVLARECSLEDIKHIKEKADIEIEVFVHGAMCISLSGRCFLSHHLFGKSANRGECLQPCRRQYLVSDAEEKGSLVLGQDYVLSPKDLCCIEFIDKIIATNVDSLKIEGRKRSPEYVSIVVSAYREAVDLYFENKLTLEKKKELFEKLKGVYNRGFSAGFYFDVPSGNDYAGVYGSKALTKKVYVGFVKNFYKKNNVALIKLEAGNINNHARLMFQGPTTGVFEQDVDGLWIENNKHKSVPKGSEVTIHTDNLVRKNDKVYLVEQNEV